MKTKLLLALGLIILVSAGAQEVRRAIPVEKPTPAPAPWNPQTPEGTDKLLRQVFTNNRFSGLILLDHDPVFMRYTPHRTHEMDLRDMETLRESYRESRQQFDEEEAWRSIRSFSRPFYAAKAIYAQNLGYGYSRGPFEMVIKLTPKASGYAWAVYRSHAEFQAALDELSSGIWNPRDTTPTTP